MDVKAFFKIQCGLFVAAVGTPEKTNGCITNTLMQQSHVPVKFSVTLEKNHLTHDMVMQKKSLGVSALSSKVPVELIRRFGFVTGRDTEKFDGFSAWQADQNGNPVLQGDAISATYSLTVYDTVDMGSHTMFLCTVDAAENFDLVPITYWDYRASLRKK